jgi:hypothetical protein
MTLSVEETVAELVDLSLSAGDPARVTQRLWSLAAELANHSGPELYERADMTLNADTSSLPPVWIRMELFQKAWSIVAAKSPRQLRSLTGPFMNLEQEAIESGQKDLQARTVSSCIWLPQLLDDDLSWTGFTLPGEK